MKQADWKPYIRFEDQSKSYTNGFEAGMVYQQMLEGKDIQANIHRENGIQIQDMAKRLGYLVRYSAIPGDFSEWFYMTAEKQIKRVK